MSSLSGGKGLSPRWSGGKNPRQGWVTSKRAAFQAKREEWRALLPSAKHLTKITVKFFMVIFLEALRAREREKQAAEKRKKKSFETEKYAQERKQKQVKKQSNLCYRTPKGMKICCSSYLWREKCKTSEN